MIVDVTLKGLKCDRCGKLDCAVGDYSDHDPIVAKAEYQKQLVENALDSDWMERDGKHYCDHCWALDDQDNASPLPLIEKCRVCGATDKPYDVVVMQNETSVWWQAEDLCVDCAAKALFK